MSAQKSDSASTPATHGSNSDSQHSGHHHIAPIDPQAGDLDVFAKSQVYYGSSHAPRKVAKSRTLSAADQSGTPVISTAKPPGRRSSQDARSERPVQFIVDVEETLHNLLEQEDTDRNVQITVEDRGPKTMPLRTAASGGYRHKDVRGTYMLSNLLQELYLAREHGRAQIVLDEGRLNENPLSRLRRFISHSFWDNLTRRIDGGNIKDVATDPKNWTSDKRSRIYVPKGAPEYFKYYTRIAKEHPGTRLDVRWLKECAADESKEADDYVRDLNEAPGLLAIAMERVADTHDGQPDYQGLPFVVPGGRFNELYGWDSYMATLGLLIDDRVDLCESMVKNFCFCIRHYGKILNANRSYYLRRSQPPFLTDMALRVYDRIRSEPHSLEFLREAILASIKDYYSTWMSPPRYDAESGLSRYHPGGRGVPPETEATHFIHILKPYADRYGLPFEDFVHAYNYGKIPGLNPSLAKRWEADQAELDEYFRHDRAVRESGHDTSYRLEKVAANLATVDLNSCLYKYEVDISRVIANFFGDRLEIPAEWRAHGRPSVESSASWDRAARKRRRTIERLMWDEEEGMFFDYDTVLKKQTGYESATTFWAMWAGACTPQHATSMVEKALPKFEEWGGLVSGTEKSRGRIDKHRPNRQWDYPFGWAPQQILAWTGLLRFGFQDEAQRLAYRWLYMLTKAFVDYNGVVVEKYDVTQKEHPHRVEAEYGNQGGDFKGVATEGFGWVNASFVYGLEIVNPHMRRALGAVTDWPTFKRMTDQAEQRRAAASNGDAGVGPIPHHHAGPEEPSEPHSHTDTDQHHLLDAHKGQDLEPVNGSHAIGAGHRENDVNLGSASHNGAK